MANAIGRVAHIEGQAFARGKDGSQHALKVGDVVLEGETIVTGPNGRVELAFDNGETYLVREKETVTVDNSVVGTDLPDSHAAALNTSASDISAITQAIAEGKSLDDLLEETAAGLDGGDRGDGHSFVQLLRIAEAVPPLSYDYGSGRGYVPPELASGGGHPDVITQPEAAPPVVPPATGTPSGSAPIANNDTLTATEDTPVTYTAAQLLGNDTDVDSSTLKIASVTSGTGGTAVLNSDGTVTFTPNANYNGPADFTYTVTDGSLTSNPATVTVNVAAVNDAPVANNDTLTATEDTPVTYTAAQLLGNDTDVDSSTLKIASVTSGTGGTAVLNSDGTVTFTPNANYNGPADFTYTVTDGSLTSNPATVTVNVAAVNDAPVANNDTLTATEDTPVTYTAAQLLGNDTDVDSSTLKIASVTSGTGGTAVLNSDGTVTFTPNANYNGPADFSYTVTDGSLTSNTATVTVNVGAVNDAPVAGDDLATTAINAPVTVAVLSNDTDPEGDSLTVSAVTNGAHGTVVIDSVSGNPIYTPATDYTGTDIFTYTVSDGHGGSTTANVTVNVGANTPPTGADATYIVTEDGSRSFAAGDFGFADADLGQTFQSVRIDSLPTAGTLTYLGNPVSVGQVVPASGLGSLVFTPAADGNGSPYASFTFSVQDSGGAFDTVPNTLTFNVTAVNDAPVAVADVGAVNEDATLTETAVTGVILGASGADTDVDNASNTLQVSGAVAGVGAVTQGLGVGSSLAGSYGHLTLNSDGSYTYVADNANSLAAGVTVSDVFTYTVTDPGGLVSNTATLTITITGTNDAAVITPAVVNLTETNAILTTGGTLAISDVDSPATFVAQNNIAGSNGYGHFTVGSNGVWSYTTDTAHNEFVAGQTYTDTLTVTSADGTTSTITVNILGTNDAAVITPAVVNLTETNAILTTGGTLAISDVDSPATFVAQNNIAGSNGYGHFTVGSNGVWSYTTDTAHNEFVAGQTYTDTLTVTSADGTTSTITVNILGTNDAAVITPAVVNLTETNAILTTGGTLAISDVDSPATFVAQNNIAGSNGYGHFTVGSNGVWSYTTDTAHNEFVAGQTYTDTLTVTSADGTTSTITVNILGTNDAAVITPAVVNLTETNAILTTGGTLAISDVDSPATFVAQNNIAGSNGYGHFTVGSNGVWSYTTDTAHNEFVAGQTYTDTLTVTSADGTTSTITVNILGTNDAAVITPAVVNLTETNAILTTGGTLAISDVDSPATFVAQNNIAGSNGYGHFTVGSNGVWSYTTDTAHNEFVAGQTYTDTLTVTSADGTTSTITVNILGTNDAAVITPAVVNLTETNAILTTGGTLAISDVDSPATFVAQNNIAGSNGYGHFTVGSNGVWSYTTDTAHNEFVAGQTYTDTLTVTSADGTTSTITVNILGTNDAAVITPAVVNLTETNAILTTGGTLAISDVDSPATFVAQNNIAGSNGYGHFTVGSNGVWSYTTDTAHNEFVAGQTYTDTLTVTSADGTTSTITVNILGTNDAAVITPAVVNLTETNAILTTGGTLAISDVDSPATFVAQNNIAGSNGYGHFTVGSNGVWSYTTDTAHNEFVAGQTYTDTLTVTSADGTTSTITVNILGTNDAAVITPAVVNLTETNAILTTGGTLAISDVDSPATFVAQNNIAGSNGYGHFTVGSNGVWSYTTDTAHNEFVAGQTYTDTLTVTSADGTTSTITVNILGTNDAAVITPAVVNLTETNAILTTGGTLAISDVDSPATFVAQNNIAGSNGYGHFTVGSNGVWSYTTDTAHNEFVAGQTYTDTLTVTSADGTTSTITVNILGTNDAAVITPAVVNLTETNAILTTGGTLAISDVDSPATFVAQNNIAGSNGYGHFTVGSNGVWSYTTDTAHNEFVAGQTYTDTLTVTSADGTTSTITVNILGTNDAAVITPAVVNLTETNAILTTGGTLAISDVDSPATFVAQNNIAGSNGYGHFTVGSNGVWSYTTDTAHNEFVAGQTYTDTLTVTSADGTTSTITVNILGTNDAAVITPAVVNLTETNAILTTGGTLAISDVDSPATFVAQNNIAGSNGYGHFTVGSNGVWSYTTDTAHNEFVAGQTYTDTLTVTSADGTTSTITVNILGTNDAAVITPAVVNLTETNAILTTGGTLAISDVDSPATFVAQNNIAGSNGYGHFTVGSNGVWSYTTDTAHNEFVAGQTYTDTLTVTSADGTTSTITVNILGTNDAAVITPAVVNLTETNAILTTGGTLAISDVDSPATFVAQNNIAGSNGYGHFTVGSNGVWSYTTDTAHNEFVAGQTYTDTLTVTSADGTTSTITVNILGTNDAAVITPAVVNLTETNAILTTGGTLAISDVDSPATFVAQNNIAGSNGYGHFTVGSNGVWSYTTDTAHNEFVAGQTYTDTLTVTSADGTTSTITVNILGTNDAAVNTVPGAQVTNEDVARVFSSANGNAITVADVDTSTLTTTVSVDHGTLAAVAFAGATISNNGSGTVTISGTAVAINGALNGLTYAPTADYNGSATLTVATNDGIAPPVISTVGLTVTPVVDIANDTVTAAEDTPVTINVNANDSFENAGHAITAVNGLAIADGGSAVSVTNGTVALVSGQLVFTPDANFHGTVPTFTYTVSSGGVTETANVNVTVTPGVDVAASWIDYWQFNEASGAATTNYNPSTDQVGTITDAVPHAGQINDPAADLRPTWTTGRNGSTAIQFNGVGGASAVRDGGWLALDSSVTDPLAGQTATKAATLSFWINTTQSGPSSNIGWDSPSVIGMENNGGTTDIQWGFINSAGKIGLGMADNPGVMSSTSVNDGQWHQVVISHNFASGATTIVVDGVLENSSTLLPGMVAPNNFLGFGVTADDGATSDRFLNGTLEDVRIYDHVLTTSQAQAIYETELMGNQSSVIANDGQPIRFALDVNDASSTVLSGLHSGTVVSDGTHTVTVGVAGTADVSGWNASEISLSNYGTGSFLFNVTGTDASGHSASEFLSVVNSTDMFTGTSGNNTLTGNANSNVLSGGAGNDILSGGAGNDLLIGGSGNDTMTGGSGADVFSWSLADRGTVGAPATDTITDFNTAPPSAGGDILDLRDLLVGENHTGADAGNLANYLHFSYNSGTNTTLVSVQSQGSGVDQLITLQGVDLTAAGTLTTDQQIIQSLLQNGKLITD